MIDDDAAKRLLRACVPALKCEAGEGSDTLKEEDFSPSSTTKIKSKNVCRLWGGKGYVYELSVPSHDVSIIVKRVSPVTGRLSLGDRRKADSYQVEANFYDKLAPHLIDNRGLNIPRPLYVERGAGDEVIICMKKLRGREAYIDQDETRAVLRWLATLHAATWGDLADEAVDEHGLQPVGTYWHLDTRPDEHMSMRRNGWQGRLRRAARAIDARLKRDKMQCCVHGDAKDANMLFHEEGGETQVSMYDFQYCGKGPPTKDLAYFLCVAAHDNDQDYVDYYHEALIERLAPNIEKPSLKDLNESLQLAYCDWGRFMCGWGFWGADLTSEIIAVLDKLDNGKDLGSEEAYDEAVRREYG
mmetsp:Transcript_8931/g.18923  ORF Transcript_8931/g.18923 Transcript_8931/m.18923 type:complete len:357 (-) Transcript_8931:220-1290(-)